MVEGDGCADAVSGREGDAKVRGVYTGGGERRNWQDCVVSDGTGGEEGGGSGVRFAPFEGAVACVACLFAVKGRHLGPNVDLVAEGAANRGGVVHE